MRKATLLLLSVLLLVPATFAQNYPRFAFYGGLSHALQEPNTGTLVASEHGEEFSIEPCTAEGADILGSSLQRVFCDRRDFHGVDLGARYNLSRYLAVRGDFSLYRNKDVTVDTFGDGADQHVDTNRFRERTYLFLGGIEVGDNTAVRFRPFAHALIGAARQTSTDRQTSTNAELNFTIRDSVTSFAFKIGGGIDVALTPHIDMRLIEVNYVPIFARERHTPGDAPFDQTVQGQTAKNVTFGFGIVVH